MREPLNEDYLSLDDVAEMLAWPGGLLRGRLGVRWLVLWYGLPVASRHPFAFDADSVHAWLDSRRVDAIT